MKTNWFTRFMARFNPASWFNDLSEFEVSIDEMGPQKKNTDDGAGNDATISNESVSGSRKEVKPIFPGNRQFRKTTVATA